MGNRGGRKLPDVVPVEPSPAIVEKFRREGQLVTILLQGPGECGKSTIMQQMRILHGGGFGEDYRKEKKRVMMQTIVSTTVEVIDAMKANETPPNDLKAADSLREAWEISRNPDASLEVTVDLAAALTALANDARFQEAVQGYASIIVQDDFLKVLMKFSNFPAWGGKDWIPTDDDLLRTRVRTTGFINNYFKVNNLLYNMLDVGGQRSERRRHMRLFNGVNQILYVASLSDYDQNLYEDHSINRLTDSLSLFVLFDCFFLFLCFVQKSLTRSNDLKEASIVMFLNKFDLFQDKYLNKRVPLPEIEDFRKPPSFDQEKDDSCELAIDWYRDLFLTQAPRDRLPKSNIYLTTAINTNMMSVVIESISIHILETMIASYKL